MAHGNKNGYGRFLLTIRVVSINTVNDVSLQ